MLSSTEEIKSEVSILNPVEQPQETDGRRKSKVQDMWRRASQMAKVLPELMHSNPIEVVEEEEEVEDEDEEDVEEEILEQRENQKNLRRTHGFRKHVLQLVISSKFNAAILSIIVLNTILITLQASESLESTSGWYFSVIDNIFMGIYLFELTVKLYALRLRYFKSGWNLFDMTIILTNVIEYISIHSITLVSTSFNPKIFRLLRIFRAFRAFRALRVLRTISFLENLQNVVNTLLKSIPAMGSITLLLVLVMYIFAIVGVHLYRDIYPERFGSIFIAIFSLFQLITLDDWFEFCDDVEDKDGGESMVAYLMIFIILETFIFVNLFIAVIVNNLQASQAQNSRKRKLQKLEQDALVCNEKSTKSTKKLSNITAKSAKKKEVIEARTQRDIDFYYKNFPNVSNKQKQIIGDFYMLLASLENNLDYYHTNQKTMDDLIDITTQNDRDLSDSDSELD